MKGLLRWKDEQFGLAFLAVLNDGRPKVLTSEQELEEAATWPSNTLYIYIYIYMLYIYIYIYIHTHPLFLYTYILRSIYLYMCDVHRYVYMVCTASGE